MSTIELLHDTHWQNINRQAENGASMSDRSFWCRRRAVCPLRPRSADAGKRVPSPSERLYQVRVTDPGISSFFSRIAKRSA